MHRFPMPALCTATLLCSATTRAAHAQIQASEPAVVAQTVDSTTITIAYSRPSARGRDLFGALVPWNVAWTGANWATTLDVNRAIRLNGVDVPAGSYSVWLIPHESAPWTVSLDRNPKIWHSQKPDSTADQIHFAATPEQSGSHVEMLTWAFPAVTGDAAALHMQWGTTTLPLQILVQPTRPVALEPDQRRAYIGDYDMTLHHPRWPAAGRFQVFEENGILRARMPFPLHPGDDLAFDLVPAGRHRFSPGLFRDGKLFNVEMGATFEFDVDDAADGAAAGVTIRAIGGRPLGEGRRAGGPEPRDATCPPPRAAPPADRAEPRDATRPIHPRPPPTADCPEPRDATRPIHPPRRPFLLFSIRSAFPHLPSQVVPHPRQETMMLWTRGTCARIMCE